MLTKEYNPRYLAYCNHHGKTPDQMLDHDKQRSPGGCMIPFMQWIDEKWRKYDALHPELKGLPRSANTHIQFDDMLNRGMI